MQTKGGVIMKKGVLYFSLAVFVPFLVSSVASAELNLKPLKKVPSTPSATPTTPPPLTVPILLVKTPAGNVNWALGTKHDITWTSSNITGYLQIDVYCDLPSPHKVGTITTNAPVAAGKYSWNVGNYLGGRISDEGKGYRIVLSTTNPPLTKSSAQFNLINASSKAAPVVKVPLDIKALSFIDPRRADLFHKGIRYTVSWHSTNLKDAKLKLELLDNKEQTVLQTIADNFSNTGSKDWIVPMTLPDAETFYKMRLQTMDGAQKAVVGPIKIAKGPLVLSSLKVTSPLTGDRTFGDVIPIRWTSTTSCSGNGGPLDVGFRVELWGEWDFKVADLTDVGYAFDNEGPSGYLNWHWNWEIVRGAVQEGTYRIKVSSMISPQACNGFSEKFRIAVPESIKKVSLWASFVNKRHCTAVRYDTGDEGANCPTWPDVPAGYGRVGSQSIYIDRSESILTQEHEKSYTRLRSKMSFPGLSSPYIRDRIVKKATLNLENTMTKAAGGYGGFCADRLYALNGPWNKCMEMPVRPGFEVPVPNSQTTFTKDVTSIVKGWMSGSIPNHGFLLTDLAVFEAPNWEGYNINTCWSYYKATLDLELE